jgi:hypothetical protein
VAARLADEGIVIAAGEPVLELYERTHPEVRIGLAGNAIDAVAVGQQHDLVIRGRTVTATVRFLLPLRSRNIRSVDLILSLYVPLNRIRRGNLVRLSIDRRVNEPGFWLPLPALTESVRGL